MWPTRNVVAVLDPGSTLAWDTKTSGARWIFELKPEGAGTRLIQRRPIPQRRTMVGRVFAIGFLGGKEEHDDELEAGMRHARSKRFRRRWRQLISAGSARAYVRCPRTTRDSPVDTWRPTARVGIVTDIPR